MKENHNRREKSADEITELRLRITELEKKDIEHKHTEKRLKETESKLEGILSSMVDLVFAFNNEGKFIFYHAPQQDDLYVSSDEFMGKKHKEIMPPHMNKLFEEAFRKNKRGEAAEYEYWLEFKGAVRWFAVKLSPLYIDRRFSGSLAVSREITERKREEEELEKYRNKLEELVEERTAGLKEANVRLQHEIAERRQAEEEANRLLRTIETAREAIFITSADGVIIYTNHAVDELFGYEEGELIGKFPSILNAGPRPGKMAEKIIHALEKKGFWDGEIHNKKKDGTEFTSYARISALKSKKGKIINFLSTQHDITESKRMAEALLESEERYRTLAENAMDAIYIISTVRGFEYVNPAFERIFGYGSKEVLHKDFSLTDLVHPDDREQIEKRREARDKGERLHATYEFRAITKKGEVRHVEVNTVPLPGNKRKILGILRDITERKKIETKLLDSESELQKQKQALEQKNIALREIIAQVEIEKRRIKDDIEANINSLISPSLEKFKEVNVNSNYLDILRYNLESLTSSFGSKITKKSHRLTPREIEICNMVKRGLSNKEISHLLCISFQTVKTHRRNIRRKLGLDNEQVNLVSFLREM